MNGVERLAAVALLGVLTLALGIMAAESGTRGKNLLTKGTHP